MTVLTTSPRTELETAGAEDVPRSPLRAMAGGALLAGVAMFAAGMATSPQQDSAADADYIAALARDTTLTEVSALLFHYGNLALGVGVLGASTLVLARRGFRLVLVGSLLAALSFLNVSGMVLADWWNMEAGRQLPSEQAVALFQGVQQAQLLPVWAFSQPLALLGPVLVLAGLARAGVLRWFHAPWFVVGVVALFAATVVSPLLAGALAVVGFWPVALVGVRLLQRHRAGR